VGFIEFVPVVAPMMYVQNS